VTELTSAEERLLQQLVTGELTFADDDVRRALLNEAFQREVEALLGVQATFDALGAPLRASQRADDVPAFAGAGELAGELVARLAGDAPASVDDVTERARPRVARRSWLVAAAAVVIALLFVARFEWPRGADADRRLGQQLELLHPQGTCEQYAPFRWDYIEGFQGWYTIEIFDEQGTLVDEQRDLESTEWSPAGERTSMWPKRIVWAVACFSTS